MENKQESTKTGKFDGALSADFSPWRRKLLKGILGFLGALGLGSLFYSGYKFLDPEASGRRQIEVPLKEIPVGKTFSLKVGSTPGILIHDEEGNLKAFSLVCTHMACIVSWQPEKKEFYCPCHDGYFDAEGQVISGPPPAPLERWAVEVKGDQILVKLA